MTATNPPAAVVRGTRALALAAWLGLVVLGLAWELWLAPTGRGTLALKVLPLLACGPGLWRHRMRTYRWLSLLLWLYVLEGLVRYAGPEGGRVATLALTEIVLCLVLFGSCGWYIRRRLGSRVDAVAVTAGPG